MCVCVGGFCLFVHTVFMSHYCLLNPSGGVADICQVQIVNHSGCELSFELSWPAHCLTITPQNGVIEPEYVPVCSHFPDILHIVLCAKHTEIGHSICHLGKEISIMLVCHIFVNLFGLCPYLWSAVKYSQHLNIKIENI